MGYFKKIFFLGALFALVAFAPKDTGATTNLVTRLQIAPQTVEMLSNRSGSTSFTVNTFNAQGQPETVNSNIDLTLEVGDTQGIDGDTFQSEVFSGKSQFIATYTYPSSVKTGTVATLTVKITSFPTVFATAKVTFIDGFNAGHSCNPNATPSECFTGNTCDTSRGLCIPNVDKRKIGTFCTEANDCSLSTGTLTLTCDTGDNNACVGATNNVLCSDNDVNNDIHYGKIATELPSDQRCGSGLVCDAKELKCVNDFGQGKVPANSIGETATDIRDQIRNLINIALGFLGVAGVIVTLYGGFTWMTAFGDDEKVGKAKKTIVAGIIGIIIIGVAWTIVSYVLNVTSTIS